MLLARQRHGENPVNNRITESSPPTAHSDTCPAADLQRLQELSDHLAMQLTFAEGRGALSVTIAIDEARQLCQMLHEAVGAAEQLEHRGQSAEPYWPFIV